MGGMQPSRTVRRYPSDSNDDEWAFVAPSLSLLPREGVQRRHALRLVFDALKWIAWTGAPWRALAHDFPPRQIVCRQAMRWPAAGVFAAMVHGAYCCAISPVARSAPRRPFSTAAPCNPRPRAGAAPALMAPSATRDRSCIGRSIRRVTLWRRTSPRPTRRTATKSSGLPRQCRPPPARASRSPMSTRAIPARGRPRRPQRTASLWSWSSLLKPGAALCCCHGAG